MLIPTSKNLPIMVVNIQVITAVNQCHKSLLKKLAVSLLIKLYLLFL